ncbi:MAG: CotH kinase family protein [Oscillospiraceae bacterium]
MKSTHGYNAVKKLLSLVLAGALAVTMTELPAAELLKASADGVSVTINEVCTSNDGENGNLTGAVDNKGEYCDWVELYNSASATADISGWTLVKDGSSSYALPVGTSIPAGGYLIVYCCKTYTGDMAIPHAGYNISSDGAALALNNGATAIDSVTVPAISADTVYARKPDGTGAFANLLPTPGASNNAARSAIPCNAPVFSQESGYYADAFDLTLTTDAGNTIYYTTDGTDPQTSATRIKYTTPLHIYDRSNDPCVLATKVPTSEITPWADNQARLPANSAVDKGTVIRACTFSAASEYSATVTKSYFVGITTADHNSLPVVSITTDPANLFDSAIGINVLGDVYDDYVAGGGWDTGNPPANYNQKGKEWERPIHIDFFESDGTLKLSQDAGIRTQGAYSRNDYQKSFRLYARDEYGTKTFDYPFFAGLTKEDGSGDALTSFKTLVLRNGGNDTVYTKFKDSYIQSLVADRGFDTQTGRACVVFIDGEYWGLYTLQEDYSDNYFEDNYDVDNDNVIVYKTGEIDEGEESDVDYFNAMMTYARTHDLSVTANYNTMSNYLDLDSFADYMATEIYIANEDWPGNNYALWRARETDAANPYADGKWRMLFYDTEMGVYHYGNYSTSPGYNNLTNILNNNSDYLPILFNKLMKNKAFKEKFVTAMLDICNVNFNNTRCTDIMESFIDAYYPELNNFFARFPTWANRSNATDGCIDRMKEFLRLRPTYIPQFLDTSLSLGTAYTLKVSSTAGGTVTINSSDLPLPQSFSGKYFSDYNVTLTATPQDGYVFKGWTGSVSSTSSTLKFKRSTDAGITAVFVPADDTASYHTVTYTLGTETYTALVADGGSLAVPDAAFAKTGYTVTYSAQALNVKSDLSITVTRTPITYTVKFNANGGTGTMASQTLTYDKAANLKTLAFTRKGYLFTGWAKTTSGGAQYKAGASVKNLSTTKNATINLYAVWRKDLTVCTVSSIAAQICNNSTLRPAVTVKSGSTTLKSGKDYSISYKNNIYPGTATATITGIGIYTGTITKTFKISLNKPVLTIEAASKTLTVRWAKVYGATGYELLRATSKTGTYKSVKVVASTTTGLKNTGLTAGKTYYYKVIAFREVNGKRAYTATSAIKSAKAK